MARAPLQILVLPYRRRTRGVEVAVFRRADNGIWQGIAGGGEDDEAPEQAARRELREEAGIDGDLIRLTSRAMIDARSIGDYDWGGIRAVPEYAFAVDVGGRDIAIGHEHSEYRWVDIDTAMSMLHWESNRLALKELGGMLMSGHPIF
jgi:dihydroneopterin triphosphate diphosphatase